MGSRTKRRVNQEPVQFTEQEARERTRWLLFNFDMVTGRYLSVPPWEQAEQKGSGDGQQR